MILMGRMTNVIYLLFIVGLYLIHINAEEQNENTDTVYVKANDTNWKLDFTILLDEFHLSFSRKIINALGLKSEPPSRKSGPTTSQKYGYGFLSVFVISTFSLAGALVFPFTKKPYYKYINAFFTSLAVGALFANSAFELFPAIIQFEPRSNRTESPSKEDEPTVPRFLWQMLALVLTSYVFYVLELMINVFVNYRNRQTKEKYNLDHEEGLDDVDSIVPAPTRERTTTILSATFPHYNLTPNEKRPPAIGWMIIIGDAIHNIADGLAIGAAFAENIIFGVAQAIAIACQELPSELGEMMILIESGFTIRRALLFNFVSACTAFAGFFIGVSISENEGARTWIFAVAAGTFTYIALVDLWPKLMPESDVFDWIRFGCVSAGYLIGVFVMFGLGIITEQLVQHPSKP